MKRRGRYDVTELQEAQWEPGSRGRVLKNLMGIKLKREMDRNYEPMAEMFSAVIRRTLQIHGQP